MRQRSNRIGWILILSSGVTVGVLAGDRPALAVPSYWKHRERQWGEVEKLRAEWERERPRRHAEVLRVRERWQREQLKLHAEIARLRDQWEFERAREWRKLRKEADKRHRQLEKDRRDRWRERDERYDEDRWDEVPRVRVRPLPGSSALGRSHRRPATQE